MNCIFKIEDNDFILKQQKCYLILDKSKSNIEIQSSIKIEEIKFILSKDEIYSFFPQNNHNNKDNFNKFTLIKKKN